MGDTLLLEVMDGVLRPLDRAIRVYAPGEDAPHFTAEDAEQIVRVCALVAEAVAGLRQLTEKFSPQGMERRELALRWKQLLRSVEGAIGSFSAARDLVRHEGLPAAGPEAGRLDHFLREAEEFRQELAGLLAWVEAPSPPLSAEIVRELEAPAPDRKYVSLDEFRAGLQTESR